MKGLLVVVLLGLLLPGELEAIKCHVCSSIGTSSSSNCNDEFEKSKDSATDCGSLFDRCAKAKIFNDGKQVSVVRTCTTDAVCKETDSSATIGSVLVRTVTACCSGDACNSGMMTSFSVTLIMTSLLMVFYTRGRF